MYRLKEFSYLTKSSVNVVIPWTDGTKTINPGLWIQSNEVYSLCTGSVVNVSSDASGKFVSIQYDGDTLFRYCFLDTCEVVAGQAIVFGDKIGVPRFSKITRPRSRCFRFEMCTSEPSEFSVRFSRLTYYKHNPTEAILEEASYQYLPQNIPVISTDTSCDLSKISSTAEFNTYGR